MDITLIPDLATLTPDQVRVLGTQHLGHTTYWTLLIGQFLLVEAWIDGQAQMSLRQVPGFFRVGDHMARSSNPPTSMGYIDIPLETAARLQGTPDVSEFTQALCQALSDALGPTAQAKILLLTKTLEWLAVRHDMPNEVVLHIGQNQIGSNRSQTHALHADSGRETAPYRGTLDLATWLGPTRILSGDSLIVPTAVWAQNDPMSMHAHLAWTEQLIAEWTTYGVDLFDFL